MSNVQKAVCAWLCVGLLAGCASTPKPPTIRDGEAVAFVLVASPLCQYDLLHLPPIDQ